ncbi:MAG: TIGR00282 family metallophosphoesterase [Actinomycetia bacterium]|nr:TIGR00282 family metallophosphoesterase [Actinomycetes bacterium]
MAVRLLCVGDVVGAPGRRMLTDTLPELLPSRNIDCVIANVENAANGSGLTPGLYEKLINGGVHLMTMGDHVYRRREIIATLERSQRMVRPANLSPGAPGRDVAIYQTAGGHKIAVISLLGRMYMRVQTDSPFHAVDRVLATLDRDINVVIVDMHAEATSEKIAMGWHLDGRVSVVFGTHTHVPTADETILPGGTGYITDLGMTGPYDSVLGRSKENVLSAMISTVPSPFTVATEDVRLAGIVADVDPRSGKCLAIERVCLRAKVPPRD